MAKVIYKGWAKPDDPICKMGLVISAYTVPPVKRDHLAFSDEDLLRALMGRDLSDLTDEELFRVLNVSSAKLRDPARWCAEVRCVSVGTAGLMTAEEAEYLLDWIKRLARQVQGEQI